MVGFGGGAHTQRSLRLKFLLESKYFCAVSHDELTQVDKKEEAGLKTVTTERKWKVSLPDVQTRTKETHL